MTECQCDVDGSVDYKCDMKNGECFCIPGTLGDKCQCKISVIELKQDWKPFQPQEQELKWHKNGAD